MVDKKKIVSEIAEDLYLKDAVVEAVIDRFIDIAVEEVVQKGSFRIPFFLTVSTTEYRGFQAGKGDVPPQKRLKVSISDGVRKLFHHQQSGATGATVTRDNWKSRISDLRGVKRGYSKGKSQSDWNPLLDEDD